MSKKNTIPKEVSKKSNVIAFLIAIAIATVLTFVLIFCTDLFIDLGAGGRTEKDYTTKKWVVEQIFEREIREGGITKYRYNFIKPAGENFNLSLPVVEVPHIDYSELIMVDDTVEVKIYIPEWQEMQTDNLLQKLKRFVKQDNREVEVFRLTLDDETLFDKNITSSDVNFRKGGNLFTSHLILILIVLAAIAYTIGIMREKAKKKKNMLNSKTKNDK